MKNSCLIYSEEFLKHGISGHIENYQRLKCILDNFNYNIINNFFDIIIPHSALNEDINRVHHSDYLNYIINFKEGMLDGDTFMTPGSLNAALKAAGSAIDGVNEAKNGRKLSFGLVRPPGHHAMPGKAMGFCIFNNVAVGAAYALSSGYKRVLIIDWDVHHGNGTEKIFYSSPDALYFSVHQYPHYPGTGDVDDTGEGDGKGFNVNVPLPAGSTDGDYMNAFDSILLPVSDGFKPDLIMISAGYDPHYNDPLGDMKVTEAGFHMMGSRVREIALKNNANIVAVLEGGYSLESIPSAFEASIRGMLNIEWNGGIDDTTTKAASERIQKARNVQKDHWRL